MYPERMDIRGALDEVCTFIRDNQWAHVYDLPATTDPSEILSALPTSDFTLFRSAQRLAHYPDDEIRFTLSHFRPDDDFILLPEVRTRTSPLVRAGIERSQTPVAVCAAPIIWQIGSVFYKTCRAMSVPAAFVSPRNPAVTAYLSRETGATNVYG